MSIDFISKRPKGPASGRGPMRTRLNFHNVKAMVKVAGDRRKFRERGVLGVCHAYGEAELHRKRVNSLALLEVACVGNSLTFASARLAGRLFCIEKGEMPLHLLKLCVGAESIADLDGWIAQRLAEQRRAGEAVEQRHTTRMVPKRAAELLDGGSLFWVIKGQVAARQRLLAIRPFTDVDGIGRCHLVLEPTVVAVETRPCRPFQGWRYLDPATAPPDAGRGSPDVVALPESLRRELRDLGLL